VEEGKAIMSSKSPRNTNWWRTCCTSYHV